MKINQIKIKSTARHFTLEQLSTGQTVKQCIKLVHGKTNIRNWIYNVVGTKLTCSIHRTIKESERLYHKHLLSPGDGANLCIDILWQHGTCEMESTQEENDDHWWWISASLFYDFVTIPTEPMSTNHHDYKSKIAIAWSLSEWYTAKDMKLELFVIQKSSPQVKLNTLTLLRSKQCSQLCLESSQIL